MHNFTFIQQHTVSTPLIYNKRKLYKPKLLHALNAVHYKDINRKECRFRFSKINRKRSGVLLYWGALTINGAWKWRQRKSLPVFSWVVSGRLPSILSLIQSGHQAQRIQLRASSCQQVRLFVVFALLRAQLRDRAPMKVVEEKC